MPLDEIVAPRSVTGPRRGTAITLALLFLAGCGSAQEDPSVRATSDELDRSRSESPEPSDPADEPARGDLSIRVQLQNPVMTAGADPNVDVTARLDGVVLVRNDGASRREITAPTPASFALEWRITDASGARWEPTFLPPPVPRPGGPPTRTLQLAPGAETELGLLHGVSGFRREGAPPDAWSGSLPVGTYTIAVSGIRLGDEVLAAPPVQLTVR